MCMLAITILWIATMQLPEQVVTELTSHDTKPQYTFSQARKMAISNMNKQQFCNRSKNEPKSHRNSWLQMIIELAA